MLPCAPRAELLSRTKTSTLGWAGGGLSHCLVQGYGSLLLSAAAPVMGKTCLKYCCPAAGGK